MNGSYAKWGEGCGTEIVPPTAAPCPLHLFVDLQEEVRHVCTLGPKMLGEGGQKYSIFPEKESLRYIHKEQGNTD